jgi:hypothetical protein
MNYTRKAVQKAISYVGGIFSKARNAVSGLFGGKTAHRRRRSRSALSNMPAETMPANSPEQVTPISPSPVTPMPSPANALTPVGPVTPQAAGKKMRARNLRGMKFYKPKKASRRKASGRKASGRKASRRVRR